MMAVKGPWTAWRRHRALVRLARTALDRTWLSRSGRLSVWYIAVTHCALLLWLASRGQEDLSFVVTRALTLISWAAGLIALGAAAFGDGQQAIWALARTRGFRNLDIEAARCAAAVEAAARPSLIAGLLVAVTALCLSATFAAAFAASMRAIGVIGYALLLGVVLGLPSRWASWISPEHPRTVFLALVFGPEAARLVGSDVPSLVAVLGGALDGVSTIAGGIG
jgi:hypothetical protein